MFLHRRVLNLKVVAGTVLEDDSWGNIEELEAELHFDPVKGSMLFTI